MKWLIVRKAVRDLAVVAVSAALLYLIENVGNFGFPEQYVPFISAGALMVYRYLRELVQPPTKVLPS